MPDLSGVAGGSLPRAAGLMAQSLIMGKKSGDGLRRLGQGEVNGFEGEAPFVRPAVGGARTAGGRRGTIPTQHVVKGAADQRSLGGDLLHEPIGIVQVGAGGLIAFVA